MTWTFTHDVDAFLTAAGPALAARPAENTVVLTVTDALRRHGPRAFGDRDPVLGWWSGPDGEVTGTLLHTPPYPASLNGLLPPQALGPLMDAHALTHVNADRETALAVAAHWPGHRIEEEQRLYRLGELVPPSPAPPGRPRLAAPADRELLVEWFGAFAADIGSPDSRADRHAQRVDERTAEGRLTLWEHEGAPVSMAGITPRIAGSARIAPVYTPPEHRGRGYAAAVTAEASRAALAAGTEELLLFTDLANPTSNGVYTRIGYRPVGDRLVVEARPSDD
ncbi:GNAT family N-acetyltransferase [Streptomyces sp. NPDC057682]|uniref:GNAT family N-acetyltransferase n=1 Tax=Streptomyces sp. NPDC057682 TaxID=3346210 RepID=UPI003689859B